MALYIDDNNNNKTFVGHIVYLWPSSHHLHPRSARAQMMLLGPQINNMPDKSLVIVLLQLSCVRPSDVFYVRRRFQLRKVRTKYKGFYVRIGRCRKGRFLQGLLKSTKNNKGSDAFFRDN